MTIADPRPPGPFDRLALALARRGRLPTPLRRAWRRWLGRIYRRRVFLGEAGGLRFLCRPFENRDDFEILAKGRLPETEEHGWLSEVLGGSTGGSEDAMDAGFGAAGPGTPGAGPLVLVDIGANVGTVAIWALRRFPRVAVVAFEPNPETLARLAANLALNGLAEDPRLVVVAAAVGEAEGTAVLAAESGNLGGATLAHGGAAGPSSQSATAGAITVRVTPLAAHLPPSGRIDVVKIDVEGFEDRALMPFFATAPESAWPRAVLVETVHRDRWREDLLDDLARRGYRVRHRNEENLLLVREG